MTCKDTQNISIRFPRIGLEIRPYTVDFRIDRTKLDYIDAKFSKEIGDYLEPYTNTEGAVLRDPQPVDVLMDGKATHRMYFRPEYFTNGETNCWIELHDPQKHLIHTVVDSKIDRLNVKSAYTRVFNNANTGDILTGIEFKIPESATSNLPKAVPKGPGGIPIIPAAIATNESLAQKAYDKFVALWQDYDEEVDRTPEQSILDTKYDFDIKNKNSLEAIYHLNSHLGLSCWVDNEGVLVVGLDFMKANHHVASANDSRVWRFHDAEITPPGSPIKMAVVNGGMIDAPNDTQEESVGESVLEFMNPTESHESDLIPQGVAQRPDVVDGKIVSVNAPNLSRDSLEDRAQQVLANEMTNNNSGSVKINPDTSGIEISDWRNVEVGDFLQLVPAESDNCKRGIERDVFLISGVRHNIDGGSWDLKLSIQKWANPEVIPTLRYFSPDSKNYYDENFNEIYIDGNE